VETRQPLALTSVAVQLKYRMAVYRHDVIGGVQAWRVPKHKRSKQQWLTHDLNIEFGGWVTVAKVVVAVTLAKNSRF
jgi:hypothetical protein